MPHIRPSWLMCDALVNSLLFLDDAPQTIDQILDHTDLRRDFFEQHLIIFRAWLLVSQPTESTYKLTSRGRDLVHALRQFGRHTPFYNFTPGELLGLISADSTPQTSNAITRIARAAFEREIEGLRALRRSLDLLTARRCMTTSQEGGTRARYARTTRGASLLRQTLARWNVILPHLPEHARTRDLYIDLTLLPAHLHPNRPTAPSKAAPSKAAPSKAAPSKTSPARTSPAMVKVAAPAPTAPMPAQPVPAAPIPAATPAPRAIPLITRLLSPRPTHARPSNRAPQRCQNRQNRQNRHAPNHHRTPDHQTQHHQVSHPVPKHRAPGSRTGYRERTPWGARWHPPAPPGHT